MMDLKNTKLYEMEFICNMIDLTSSVEKIAEDCGFYGAPEDLRKLHIEMLRDAADLLENPRP